MSIGDGTNSSYGGNISGAGSLVLIGSGTVTLNGANTYTGGTVVSAGNLALGFAASIPATGKILIQNGARPERRGAYSTVTGWLNSGTIDPSSAGALALPASSNENINLATAGGGATRRSAWDRPAPTPTVVRSRPPATCTTSVAEAARW